MTLPSPVSRLRIFVFISLLFLPFCFSAAQNVSPAPRIIQSINEKQLVSLKGNVHPLARVEFDQGVVPDSQPMQRMLLLLERSPEQETSLRQLLDDQQSKSSSNFHQWLTPEQFGAQFGPADSDVLAVTQWLTAQGFTNINVGPGRTVIEFSGNAGQVRNAFHTEIHHFQVDAESHIANSGDPQIPAALAPVVAGIVSLHNFPRKSHAKILGKFRRTIGKPGITPLLTFPDPFGRGTFYGMGPGDFATIYNSKPLITAGNDGTGQTIAIVGETNIKLQDIQQFRQMFGLPANFDASNIILNGEDPGTTSIDEEGEADLDVEWSGATAPGATVKFVVSASTPASAGVDLSALYIIEHNLAGVMSESYGECESALGATGNAFYNSLWEQAAAQGITVIVSSGDGGSAGCDNFNTQETATRGLAVSGLASTPFNISLGGTDFDEVNRWTTFWNSTNDATGSSAKSYIPEIPWNENCAQISFTGCGSTAPDGSLNLIAGSGGQSKVYPKPTWQLGIAGMPNDNHRDQPDVSLLASNGFDGTGYIYCQSDSNISGGGLCDVSNAQSGFLEFGIIGGTSASAPAFAGVMALVNQKQVTSSDPAPRQGNANHTLYALAKKTGASCTSSTTELATCIFNDVIKGNSFFPAGVGTNSVPCKGGTLNCSVTNPNSNGVLVDPSHTTTEAWTATAGYDMATGLGSVNINNLANGWSTASTIPTTTTLSLSPTTSIPHGTSQNVTVGVTVHANTGTGVPAGDVSLIATLAGGATQGLDQFTLANGSVTNGKTSSLPGGTYNITAHYAGDGTNAPSDSTPVQVTVATETSQTFIVIPSFDSTGKQTSGNASSVAYGSNYIIRMYVTDKNGVASPTGPPAPTCDTVNPLTCPTGTTSLTANSAPLDGSSGTFNLNSAGYTRDLVPTLTGGTYSLVAHYGGDSSYQSSTSAPRTFTVTPASTQLNLSSSSNAIVGSPLNLSLLGIPNVTTGLPATGSVSIFDGATQIAGPIAVTPVYSGPGVPVLFSVSTQATFSVSGDHSLTASYSGDADYASATSASQIVHAVYPTTMTVTADATTINYGKSVTITAKALSAYKNPAMTGQILFFVNGSQISGSATALSTDSSGNQVLTATATLTPQAQFVGVQAGYSGDTNFQNTSGSVGINVNIPDFTLPQSTVVTVTAGQSQTFSINVTPLSSTPSTVTLSPEPFNLPSGMNLTFNPSSVNMNGSAVPVSVTLSTLGPSGGPVVAAITHGYFFGPPSRWVWWSMSLACGLVALLGFVMRGREHRYGLALWGCTLSLFTFMLGCGGGGSSSSGGGGGGSTPEATSITLSTSNAKIAQGGSFTLTATITASKPLTGTVNIFQGSLGQGSGIAPPITVVNGKAAFTMANFFNGPGTYQFWAQYTGDSKNLPSQSTATVQEVVTGQTVTNFLGQTGGLSHEARITINLQ